MLTRTARFGLPPAIAAGFLACASPATGLWALPTEAPVERLIENVGRYTKEHPNDAEGYYVLGRIHSLAFSLKCQSIWHYERGPGDRKDLPFLGCCWDEDLVRVFQQLDRRYNTTSSTPTAEEMIAHLRASVEDHQTAIRLAPHEGLYHLGLASVLEAGEGLACALDVKWCEPGCDQQPSEDEVREWEAVIERLGDAQFDVREKAQRQLRSRLAEVMPILERHRFHSDAEIRMRVGQLIAESWTEQMIHAYLRAYQLAIKGDINLERRLPRGIRDLVSYEAGEGYLRTIAARGVRDDEQKQVEKVEQGLANLEALPDKRLITPIVFSLGPAGGLTDLLAADSVVCFDLDGDLSPELWPWVKPATGILVWDPAGQGRITSGRQLFGSATWWMFFRDGYHALDALDDNRNGELSGAELEGLAIWRDRNSDGVSDPGEVQPIETSGVLGIATRAAGYDGISPMNPRGLRLRGGRILPTYDWVTRPAGR